MLCLTICLFFTFTCYVFFLNKSIEQSVLLTRHVALWLRQTVQQSFKNFFMSLGFEKKINKTFFVLRI